MPHLSFPISFFILFFFFVMSFEPKQQEGTGGSPIIEAKSLLSQGDIAGAFDVLKKAAEHGDVMACYDCGFMMIQGIGCKQDWREGLKLLSKGVELEKESEHMSWKSDGSVSELFEPQSMNLSCLLLLMNLEAQECFSAPFLTKAH